MYDNSLFQKVSGPRIYEVRIEGHIGRQWVGWFDGMNIEQDENGETLISGPVKDQAALFGLLKKVRDLGLTLISVNRNPVDHTKEQTE
jgi:hypothetical protein